MTITLQCRSAAKNIKRIAAERPCGIEKCRLGRTTTMFSARNDILR